MDKDTIKHCLIMRRERLKIIEKLIKKHLSAVHNLRLDKARTTGEIDHLETLSSKMARNKL